MTEDWVDLELEQGTWIKIAQMAERENITMAHAIERLAYTTMLKLPDGAASYCEKADEEILALHRALSNQSNKINKLKAKVRLLKEDLEDYRIMVGSYVASLEARDEVILQLRNQVTAFGTYLSIANLGDQK